MSDIVAFGVNIAILGFALAFVPLLPNHKTWARMSVMLIALLLWVRYLLWRVSSTAPTDLMSRDGVYFVCVFVFEAISLTNMALFFGTVSRCVDRRSEADRLEKWLREQPAARLPTVDVFITTYNEDAEILERGIVSARALDYPCFKVWVCDDGKREWLRDLCEAKGVGYITRPDNRHAKAGNVNHALSVTSGELFAVFDADFVPFRQFLYRTVGFFFADPYIVTVQTPQHFFNPDVFQVNLGFCGMTQDNEREWYDSILASRDAWDCTFFCGSCAVLRRDAIEGVGGIAVGSVTEDNHTSILLMRKGYITRYLNERLSMGMAPEDLPSLIVQRRRWARGGIQLLFLKDGPLGRGLSLIQRWFFIQYHYIIDFPCRLFMLLLPQIYLWTGATHMQIESPMELLAYQGPALIATMSLNWWLLPNTRVPLVSNATAFYLSWRVYPCVLSSLLRPFGVGFHVTPKGRGVQQSHGDPIAARAVVVAIVLCLIGIAMNRLYPDSYALPESRAVATFWALGGVLMLLVMLCCLNQTPQARVQQRFPISEPGTISIGREIYSCRVVDISLTGALIECAPKIEVGETLRLQMPGTGFLLGRVMRREGDKIGVNFEHLSDEQRDRLIVGLYASGLALPMPQLDRLTILGRMVRLAFLGY